MAASDFGARMRAAREREGLTQQQLGQRIGCSVSLVRKLESGERRPTRQIAALVAAALKLSLEHTDASAELPPGVALPAPLSPLVGREQDLARLTALITRDDVRWVTLTGFGGVGKTRLALALGRDVADIPQRFDDGVVFVALAAISSPALFMQAVAGALGLSEAADQAPADAVIAHLRGKRCLLILDNFEQITGAADDVLHVLEVCPRVKVVLTSRESLNVRGEWLFPVQPFPVMTATPEEFSPAVQLFTQRARAVRPGFEVTPASLPAITQICARLDGLPLAIELAAARMKMLSPQQIVEQLAAGRARRLLRSDAPDLPERHRALDNVVAWSFASLWEDERRLFGRLSVFRGGWSLESAEAVCEQLNGGEADLLDGLSSLLDKSLIKVDDGSDGSGRRDPWAESRFDMLATLRDFAEEQLAAMGEAAAARQAHASHMLALAQAAKAELRGEHQHVWIQRLELEHDNLRAALAWLIAERDAHRALALAGALWLFWYVRSYYTEGRKWLEAALALPASSGDAALRADALYAAPRDNAALRADALYAASAMAQAQGDLDQSTAFSHEGLAIRQALGDARGEAAFHNALGNVRVSQGEHDLALRHFEEALQAFRGLGDARNMAITLNNLGRVHENRRDAARAREHFEAALALIRPQNDTRIIATLLGNLGVIASQQGDHEQAVTHHAEALALRRKLGDQRGVASTLGNLGDAVCRRLEGDPAAEAYYRESLSTYVALGDRIGVARGLERMAWFVLARDPAGNADRAAALCGAAEAALHTLGATRVMEDAARLEVVFDRLRAALGPAALELALGRGRVMSLEQAVALALEPGA